MRKTFSQSPRGENSRAIACPVCGKNCDRLKWSLEGYSFSRCCSCGLLYQNPQPLQEELVRRYDTRYFDYEIENEEAYLQLMLLGLKDAGFFGEIEERFSGQGSFLDIGCATGSLLFYMKERGWRGCGVEVCEEAAEYARSTRGLDVRTGTLEKVKLPGESFDVIHASHLIEHLTDPRGFIQELSRLMKPGGYTFLVTPNAGGFQAVLFASRWRSAIADHMFLFSKKNLTRLLESEGFTVELVRTWGGIAAGLVPRPLKVFLDRMAKKTGLGDVMILRARKAL